MVEEVAYLVKMENVAHLFMRAIEYDVCNGIGSGGGGRSYTGRGRNHR